MMYRRSKIQIKKLIIPKKSVINERERSKEGSKKLTRAMTISRNKRAKIMCKVLHKMPL